MSGSRTWLVALLLALAGGFLYCSPWLVGGKVMLPADSVLYTNEPWKSESPRVDPLLAARGWRGTNYFTGDAIEQSYAWRTVAARAFAEGSLPLWNPYAFSGSPLAGNGQSAPFYPLGFPLWLGELARGMVRFAALHLALLGFFTWLLLREEGASPAAAALAGVTMALSGPVIVTMARPEFVSAIAWMPLVLWAARRAVRGAPGALPALAVAVGMELAAGHLQYAAYALLAAAAYALVALPDRPAESSRAAGLAKLAGGVLLGFGIAAIALLPVADFLRHALRKPYPLEGTWGFGLLPMSLPLGNLVTLALPDWLGNPVDGNYLARGYLRWDNYVVYCVYAGVLPLALALPGALARRSRFWVGMLAAALLFATGSTAYLPLYRLLPGFDRVNPARFVVLAALALAALAAHGLDAALARRRALRQGLAGAAVLALGAGVLLAMHGAGAIDLAVAQGPDAAYRASALARLALIALAAGAALALAALRPALALVPAAIAAADLATFGMRFNPRADARDVFPSTPSIAAVRATLGDGRLAANRKNILFPNATTALAIPDVRGYDSFVWERYVRFCELVAPQGSERHQWGEIHINRGYASPLVDLLGIRAVLADRGVGDARFTRVWQGARLSLYRNERAFPMLVPFGRWRVIPDSAKRLAALASPAFDPHAELILEKEPPANVRAQQAAPTGAPDVQWSAKPGPLDELRFDIDAAQPVLLLVRVAGVPGWRAELDGKSIPWQYGDHIFPVVAVPAGRHRLRMVYRPASAAAGAGVTLLSLALLAWLSRPNRMRLRAAS